MLATTTWSEIIVPIVVALIMVGVPAWVSMRKFRSENSNQHAIVTALLTDVRGSQAALGEKIDERFDIAMDEISKVKTSVDRHLGEHEGVRRLSRTR